jgi:ABC-type antimicrobial peptide transport system permease subunit
MGVGVSTAPRIEIVGLVQDAKYSETRAPAPPQFFLPYRQNDRVGSITFYARADRDASIVMQAIPPAIARLDSTLPVENLRTMPDQVRESTAADRLVGTLSVLFAALATFLAAIGLYGMLSFTVAQRTREIGVRMALGADTAVVRRMVLGQVARMLLAGGSAGIVTAIALGRVAQSLLFGLESHDPAIVAAASAILALIALGAGIVPAYRASRIDPIRALRFE